jgi:hypothetical protein
MKTISISGISFKDPDYVNAVANRMKTYLAIRDGLIIRKPCELCGKEAIAHHEEYENYLEVRWLCWSHHNLIHATFRGGQRARRITLPPDIKEAAKIIRELSLKKVHII